MSDRIKVETYRVGAKKTDPATQITPSPVRSIIGKRGSTTAKKDAQAALEKLGYKVRSVNFTEAGIVAYVDGGPTEEFNSARSGPRGGSNR